MRLAVPLVLCLFAAAAAAQSEKRQKVPPSKTYPVWWATELNLARLEDVPNRLSEPFSEDDLRDLRSNASSFAQSAQPDVRSCNELLAVIDPKKWEFWSLDRIGSWGDIGAECAIIRELGRAVPARRSAIQNLAWTAALFSALPAGVCYANGEESHAAAVEADKRGESLRQFWKGKVGVSDRPYNGRVALTLDDDRRGAGYVLMARGDFDGNGWEDIVLRVTGAPHHSARMTVAVYVLTRTSASDRFRVIREIF